MRNKYKILDTYAIIYVNYKNKTYDILVDINDLEFLLKENIKYIDLQNGKYARCYYNSNDRRLLHRVILNAPKDKVVDHINHNTYDNRRKNLRIVSRQQNAQNRRGAQKNNKSTGIRGVSFYKRDKKYEAYYFINGKKIHLGMFNNMEDAERAVVLARKKEMFYLKEVEK
jgi:hypothetical protein